ncbi:MAG: hypothetical protein AB3X44_08250 [Leptothrix sp. (in: b-proteobacteria)]
MVSKVHWLVSRCRPNPRSAPPVFRKVGWSGADESKETLELTRIEQLDAKAMNAMRKKALALEASGYAHSKNMNSPKQRRTFMKRK